MIVISHLAKKFAVENPKKLSEQEKKDPRLKGKFFHSVKDVSFSCQQGEVLGLLGPNGAGKTTTLRMLSTALKPDSGDILLGGVNVVSDPLLARKKIGFLSGATGLYAKLTGRENITYFGQLHGMSLDRIKQKIEELGDTLDLHSFLDRRCGNYSTGMKQRIAIARTVVHEPDVVILDEPTTGLDIMATQTVLNFIRGLKNQGVPVIFSTHHLAEVDELCDRVSVINHGLTEFDDTITAFRDLAPQSMHQAFLHTLKQDV